jgi:hypothetical protein
LQESISFWINARHAYAANAVGLCAAKGQESLGSIQP